MAKARAKTNQGRSTPQKSRPRKWSAEVTETSDAMDFKGGVFKSDSPNRIAASVKRSAELSHRRKSSPFRSAMSMVNFYINRAGKNPSARRRRILEASRNRLRQLFHRPTTT